MADLKSSAMDWFKDKEYWEGIAVGSVTTLFGEWVAIAASSALSNKGVLSSQRQSNTFQGIIDLLFGWGYYALFKSYNKMEFGVIASSVMTILGIYKLIEALVGTNPYTYVSQKASLVAGFGKASIQASVQTFNPPPVITPPPPTPTQQPAKAPVASGIKVSGEIL